MNIPTRYAALALGLTLAATAAHAQPSVGVSIDIRQPGVYGRIDIGNAPPPPVVYTRPVVITAPPRHIEQAPIYLYVPPGHQRRWAKHCAKYHACGQPVLFVREQWAAEQRSDHRGRRGDHDDHGDKHKHKGRGHGD